MVGKKYIVIGLLSLMTLLVFSCESEPRSSWTFYWELYNSADSTRINMPINYIFTVTPCESGDCNVNRESDSTGFIAEWLMFYEWEDDFLSKQPTLECEFYLNEHIIYDSIYVWTELDFNQEFNDPYSQFDSMVGNYQKIYLNIPE